MQIGGRIVISMKTIIFILAISAVAAPIFATTCTGDAALAASNCVSCRSSATTACNSCAQGYYLKADNTCSLCPSGKGKAAGTAIDTDATGTANGDTVCDITCSGGCQVCGATGTVCHNCKAGYFKSAANVCTWCTGGKGKDADLVTAVSTPSTDAGVTQCGTTCTAASNCGTCSAAAAGTCLACAAGRYLKADNTCDTCTAGCKTCTATGLAACPTCSDNFYYSAANTCMACPSGKTRTAPTTAPTTAEADTVCTSSSGSGSSATLIQALCGASVAAYALF